MQTIRFKLLGLASIFMFLSFNGLSQKNSEKGDRYFDQNQFEMAAKYYEMDIHSKDKKTSEYALKKLANCYRISGEFEKAELTFKKILKKKKKDPLNYLNYGLALKNSAKFAEAKEQLQEYVKLAPDDQMGQVFLLSCDSAQLWLDETIGKEVKNLEKINTQFSEFSPVLLNSNELLFTSSREGSTKMLISLDGGGDVNRLDLYSIKLNNIESKENKKTDLINFREINTPLHEGSACFSSDGKELFFTKTIKGKRDKETNEILGTLQVFYSKKDSSGKWSSPKSAFIFNSLNYSIGHPSLSKDGNIIYYMSDIQGGFGKTDIYYSIKQDNGTWGSPINAGNEVNTFGHEMFPTITQNGILYFSSNAHPGMGQLDIFESTFGNGKWTNVHNLKPPINSIANDFGIIQDGEYKRGVFSSDRFNGKGAEDLYSFTNELPLELSLVNDTLSLKNLMVFDDLKYTLINETDSSEVDLLTSQSNLIAGLQVNKTYKLKASKYGMKYNELRFSYKKEVADTSMLIQVSAGAKDLNFSGRFDLGKKSVHLPIQDSTSASQTPATGSNHSVLNLNLNKEGSFYFDAFIPASSQIEINSNEIIQEVEIKN